MFWNRRNAFQFSLGTPFRKVQSRSLKLMRGISSGTSTCWAMDEQFYWESIWGRMDRDGTFNSKALGAQPTHAGAMVVQRWDPC